MKIVDEDKKFVFKRLCPYCGGDLTYHVTGWIQDEENPDLWLADNLESECSNEPSITKYRKWEEWSKQHSDMPYLYQLPINLRVRDFINKLYRFKLK